MFSFLNLIGVKTWATVGILAGLIIAVLFLRGHWIGVGESRIQALRDADQRAAERLAGEAEKEYREQMSLWQSLNTKTVTEYEKRVVVLDAANGKFAILLRDAQREIARRGRVSGVSGRTCPVDSAEDPGNGELADLVGKALEECKVNVEGQRALQDVANGYPKRSP